MLKEIKVFNLISFSLPLPTDTLVKELTAFLGPSSEICSCFMTRKANQKV